MKRTIAGLAVSILCAAPAATQSLYYTEGSGVNSKVGRADLDGSNHMVIVPSGLNSADGIRLDVAGGKLYWAEQGGNIQRANIDGSDVEVIVPAGGNPHAVALDLTAGKVYWTELANDRIRRANLNGSSVETVTNVANPDGLTIDPAGGKIYWTTGNRIRRANLDGTGNEVLYVASTPHGLALDVAAGKIYWAGLGNGRIQRGDMDGSGVAEDLVTGLSSPLDVALDLVPGKMYWTELGGGGSVKRANLDGTDVEPLLDVEIAAAFGVAVTPTSLVGVPLLPRGGLALLAVLFGAAGCACVARRGVKGV